MKILHVITSLTQGGAQAALYRLIAASVREIGHEVVSLTGPAYYGTRLNNLGISVHLLSMPRGRLSLSGVIKLMRILRTVRPDVVQTWMYHADLIGGVMARCAGIQRVVWGIRNSTLQPRTSSLSARVIARLNAFLSPWLPNAITCCSIEAARIHQSLGYCADKLVVIPNGYDLGTFYPVTTARRTVRAEWGVDTKEALIGMVARWDPQKDHKTLLRALRVLKERGTNLRCALVGEGMDASNKAVSALIAASGVGDLVILAGPRDDVPSVMSALDLHVLSSSYGEAFPNVIAEAMACGTPCVVTNVGDAAQIVGDTGWIVEPGKPEALANSIADALQALQQTKPWFVERCRRRIEQHFQISQMVEAFRAVWSAPPNNE